MKLDSKAVRVCLVCFLAVCIALPVFAFARDDTFIELPERLGTSPEIAIEVPFDSELMAATVSKSNVYVTEDQGSRIPVNIDMGSDLRSIIVEPAEQYEAGKTYTLYIRNAVKYASGSRLKDGLKLKFTIAKAAEEPLPVVGSGENLRKLLEEAGEQDYYFDDYGVKRKNGVMALDSATAAPASAANESTSSAKLAADTDSGDYSTTNVQVEGVDEADIVKTDGKYLYQVNNDRIVVAEIYPSDKMKIKKIIELEKENVYPMELYLDDKYLVLIGTSNNAIPVYRSEQNSIMPEKYPYYNNETVKLIAYDITDKADIKKVREIELEGSYLSSRKIGSKLYLVSNKGFNYRRILDDAEVNDTPSYRDTAVKEEFINIDYGKIGYFPGSVKPNYMIVAGIDFDLPKEGVNVSTYLGSGESIYASAQNLYVAVTRHNIIDRDEDDPIIYDSAAPKKVEVKVSDRETVIYRFALNNGKLDYTGKGQVPGSILNQFSMDEYEGDFRIATTVYEYKPEIQSYNNNNNYVYYRQTSYYNNLYILDEELSIAGKIEGIAPNERIYSVRFDGDIGYMVTFRQTDPLFAVDLSDKTNPKILSALKIPGFSSYMHPYGEGLLFGFGKDANENGQVRGLKLSMFDISDKTDVKEKSVLNLGQEYYHSEAIDNHKAILVDSEKNLIGFPVFKSGSCGYEFYTYKNNSFVKVGGIDLSNYYISELRGLYIGNYIYIFAENMFIKSYNIDNFELIETLSFTYKK